MIKAGERRRHKHERFATLLERRGEKYRQQVEALTQLQTVAVAARDALSMRSTPSSFIRRYWPGFQWKRLVWLFVLCFFVYFFLHWMLTHAGMHSLVGNTISHRGMASRVSQRRFGLLFSLRNANSASFLHAFSAASGSATAVVTQTVEEIIVDASNQCRNDFAASSLDALREIASKGDFKDADHLERYIEAASEKLAHRLRYIFEIAQLGKSRSIVFVLDSGEKKDGLLKKYRHAGDAAVALKAHDMCKVRRFLKKKRSSAIRTLNEAKKSLISLIADQLHRSEAGRQLIRLMLTRATRKLAEEFGQSVQVSVGEALEADIATVDSDFSVATGKYGRRNVLVIQNDADLCTQIPIVKSSRWEPGHFVQAFRAGGSLILRSPAQMQKVILNEFGVTEGSDLFVNTQPNARQSPHLTKSLFAVLGPAMTDYKTESRVGKSPFLRDSKGTLSIRYYLSAVQEMMANKGSESISFTELRGIVENSKAPIWTSAKGEICRERFLRMLDADLNDSLKVVLYGALSRLLIMFPLSEGRKAVLPTVLSFYPKSLLEDSEVKEWVKEARSRDLKVRQLPAVNDAQCVQSFWKARIAADERGRQAKRSRPGRQDQQKLKWWDVMAYGSFGPLSAGGDPSSSNSRPRKKKKAAAASPKVVLPAGEFQKERQGYDCSLPGGEQVELKSLEEASRLFGEFLKKLCKDPRAWMKKLTGDNSEGIPFFLPVYKDPDEPGAHTVLIIGQAMQMGEEPLIYEPWTGAVCRLLVSSIRHLLVGNSSIHAISDDIMPQLSASHSPACPECNGAVFPEKHWWHDFEDPNCNCPVCVRIRGCERCQMIHRCLKKWAELRMMKRLRELYASNSMLSVVTLGSLAQRTLFKARNALNALKAAGDNHCQSTFLPDENIHHLTHPGALFSHGKDDDNVDQRREVFWDGFLSAVSSLSAGTAAAPVPVSPEWKMYLYDLLKQCAGSSSFSISSCESLKLLHEKLSRSKFFSAKGSAGYGAGFLRGQRAKSKVKKPKSGVDPKMVTVPAAIRRLIPFSTIRRGAVLQNILASPAAIKAFEKLFHRRLCLLHQYMTHMRTIFSVLNLCRVVRASQADSKLRVRNMGLKQYQKVVGLFMEENEKKRNDGLVEIFGDAEIVLVVQKLRTFFRETALKPLQELGLAMRAKSLATQVSEDTVTRADVSMRSQLLSAIQLLFFHACGGHSDSLHLAMLFAFSADAKSACDVLLASETEGNDDDVNAALFDSAFSNSDGDAAEEWMGDDADSAATGDETPVSLSHTNHIARCKAAYLRLSPTSRRAVLDGGEKVHDIMSQAMTDCSPVPEHIEEPFQRWNFFMRASSIAPHSKSTPTDDSADAGSRRPQRQAAADGRKRYTNPSAAGAESAKDLASKANQKAWRNPRGSMPHVRAVILGEVLKFLPAAKGFRPAPMPEKSLPLRLYAEWFNAKKTDAVVVGAQLTGPLSDSEKLMQPEFAPLKEFSGFGTEMSLQAVFNLSEPVSSVLFNSGNTISTLQKDRKRISATKFLKTGTRNFDDLYSNPRERKDARTTAAQKAATNGNLLYKANHPRIPLSKTRGYVTEAREVENMQGLVHDSNGRPIASATESEAAAAAARGKNDSEPPQAAFSVKFGSPENLQFDHDKTIVLLKWLRAHPLVALDPGQRWAVSGVIVRVIDFELDYERGSVNLSVQFRKLRLSGHKWNNCGRTNTTTTTTTTKEVENVVQSFFKPLLDSDFLRAQPEAQWQCLTEKFSTVDFSKALEATSAIMLDKERVLHKELRLTQQKEMALAFARKIDKLCEGYGDPIVIIGAAGGSGGRGRAQVDHSIVTDCLAGFFKVILLDEYNTSKKTTCCHTDAHAPRSAGRSRGCKRCKLPNDKMVRTIFL